MARLLSACIALLWSLAATEQCQGMVIDHRWYHLGENDLPPAIVLAPGDNPTVDSGTDLAPASKVGLTFYHPLGLVAGSTFAMEFTNVDSRYVAPAALVGVTQDFGMEAYIQVSPGVIEARVFYNGGDGTPFGVLTSGYGLGIHNGLYAAIVAGSIVPTTVAAVPGVPVEMALVNLGGTQFDVYIQKALVLTFVAAVIPPAATEVLSLGNFVGNQAPPAFAGVLDEARVFTFAPGGFSPSTDLGAAAAAVNFAGTPGLANCHGKSVAALAKEFGGLHEAAATLGFSSMQALHDAIREFCEE